MNGKVKIDGRLIIDFDGHKVSEDGGTGFVILPDKPFRVLEYLWENRNRICRPGDIFSSAWGYGDTGIDNEGKSVKDAVSQLRKKLKDAVPDFPADDFIANRKGVGYMLNEQDFMCEWLPDEESPKQTSSGMTQINYGGVVINSPQPVTYYEHVDTVINK